jgi:hypothetical protein
LLKKCGAYDKLVQLANGSISEQEMIGEYYVGEYLIFEVTKCPDSSRYSYTLHYFDYYLPTISYTNKDKIFELAGIIEKKIPQNHFECWECGRIRPLKELQDDGTCGC